VPLRSGNAGSNGLSQVDTCSAAVGEVARSRRQIRLRPVWGTPETTTGAAGQRSRLVEPAWSFSPGSAPKSMVPARTPASMTSPRSCDLEAFWDSSLWRISPTLQFCRRLVTCPKMLCDRGSRPCCVVGPRVDESDRQVTAHEEVGETSKAADDPAQASVCVGGDYTIEGFFAPSRAASGASITCVTDSTGRTALRVLHPIPPAKIRSPDVRSWTALRSRGLSLGGFVEIAEGIGLSVTQVAKTIYIRNCWLIGLRGSVVDPGATGRI
jgi:hypothetical protein